MNWNRVFTEGRQAHRDAARRTANPYMVLAVAWDSGWVSRQREQLATSGKNDDADRISRFKDFIAGHLR